MSALIKYTKFSLFLGGTLLAEANSVDATYSPGTQKVITTEKGLSGFSPGAGEMTLKIDSAMPRAGIEFDYVQAAYDITILDVVMFRAGKKVKTKGVIMDASEQGGADKPSAASFSMTCSIPEFSTL